MGIIILGPKAKRYAAPMLLVGFDHRCANVKTNMANGHWKKRGTHALIGVNVSSRESNI